MAKRTKTAEQGRAIMRQLFGEAEMVKRDASTTDFNEASRNFSDENCFGSVWARPGIATRDRSLMCISHLAALGRMAEMQQHIEAALRNKFLTPSEIKEICLQTIVYCGLPAGQATTRAAEEALLRFQARD